MMLAGVAHGHGSSAGSSGSATAFHLGDDRSGNSDISESSSILDFSPVDVSSGKGASGLQDDEPSSNEPDIEFVSLTDGISGVLFDGLSGFGDG